MTPLERLRRLVGEDGPGGATCPGGTTCPSCPDGANGATCPSCPEPCPGGAPSQRVLTDDQLQALLDECGGDVAVAAYQALLYKSQNSGLTLASGLRLPDQSAHYRRLARLYRPQARGTLRRADEGRNES